MLNKLQLIPHFRRKVLFAVISSLSLIIVSYFINNASILTGESSFQYYITQYICEKIGLKKSTDYTDALFVNTSYDKTLIPYFKGDFENKKFVGNTIITDRNKLLSYLKLLHKTDSYKCVIIDITFDEGNITDADSSLSKLLFDMRNVFLAAPKDLNPTFKDISSKFFKTSYKYTPFNTDFYRYQFSFNEKESIALSVYKSLNNSRYTNYGFWPFKIYFSNGRLCQNSAFIIFDNDRIEELSNDKFVSNSYFSNLSSINLGETLEDYSKMPNSISFDLFKKETKDKIIVIGNTQSDNDAHATYTGYKSGPEIIYCAIKCLEKGNHLVNPLRTLIWFSLFTIVAFCILANINILYSIPLIKRIQNKFIRLIISLFNYTILFFTFSIIEYIVYDTVYSILLPLYYFAILKIAVQFNTTYKK